MGEAMSTGRDGGKGSVLTIGIWVVGVGLQFAAPLLRDRVPLSDDLFIGSILAPWWSFGQVLLLAGFLTLFRRPTNDWGSAARAVFASAAAAAFSYCGRSSSRS